MTNDASHLVDPGMVYVDSRCCTNCGVPWHFAPEVFTEGTETCEVTRQPRTATELRKVLRVFRAQELGCVRYSGTNPRVIAILHRVGEGAQCDSPLVPETPDKQGVAAHASPTPWWRRLFTR